MVTKYCNSTVKKLAAETLAADSKSICMHTGNGDQSGILQHGVSSAEARHLLLQSFICSQAYPSFAMLPLLQQSQRQLSRSLCCLPRLQLQPKRPFQVQAPSFAARPLYMNRRRKACISFSKANSTQMSDRPETSANLSPPRKSQAVSAAHPLYNYAALHQGSSVPQATAAIPHKHSASGLRTYAVMAVPATEQRPKSRPNNLHGTLSSFAKLSTQTAGVVPGQTASKPAGKHAWKHYAHLRTRS